MKFLSWIVLALSLAGAVGAVELPVSAPAVSIEPNIYIFHDASGEMPIEAVLNLDEVDFELNTGQTINRGIVDGVYWLRFRLSHTHPKSITRYLELKNTFIPNIQFFAPDGGQYSKIDLAEVPFFDRPVVHRYPTFPMVIEPDTEQTYYVRMEIRGTFSAPLTIWNPNDFRENMFFNLLGLGLLFGGLVAMAVYHGFMVIAMKDTLYLFYVAFLVFAILFELHIKGLAHYFLWSAHPYLYFPMATLALGGMVGFNVLFARSFMESKVHIPKLDKGLVALAIAAFTLGLLGFTYRLEVNYLSYFLGICWSVYLFFTVTYAWLGARLKRARFLAFAWAAMLSGSLGVSIVNTLGLETAIVITFIGETGLVFSVIMFGIALADRTHLKAEFAKEKLQEEVNALEGLLSICSSCKKIQNEDGGWSRMESYVRERADVEFTHSYCPPCVEKHADYFELRGE